MIPHKMRGKLQLLQMQHIFFSEEEKNVADDYTLQERCYVGCYVLFRFIRHFPVFLTQNQADNLDQFLTDGAKGCCK